MSDDCCGKCNGHAAHGEGEVKRRPRKATLLNMQWLKERLCKAQGIKEKLESGAYNVDSEMLAKAVLNKEK